MISALMIFVCGQTESAKNPPPLVIHKGWKAQGDHMVAQSGASGTVAFPLLEGAFAREE